MLRQIAFCKFCLQFLFLIICKRVDAEDALIIQLEMADKQEPQLLDRLSIKRQHEEVLSVKIPKVKIPIAAGRNIAVLVEVAIRNHMLLLRGINATKQFTQRQQREMKKSIK